MIRISIGLLAVFTSVAGFATDRNGCQEAMTQRPLGLELPNALPTLEKLLRAPSRRLEAPGALATVAASLLPRGPFAVVQTSVYRHGDEGVRAFLPAPADALTLRHDGPTLATRGLALRAQFARGRDAAWALDLSAGPKTEFSVWFRESHYYATFTAPESTLVLRYDYKGRLDRILAFRRDHADVLPPRGTSWSFVVPTP